MDSSFFLEAVCEVNGGWYLEVTHKSPGYSLLFLNPLEHGFLRKMTRRQQMEEAWVSSTPLRLEYRNPVQAVREALEDAALIAPKQLGKFFAYDPGQKRAVWTRQPELIAREMNHSHMFDFHVSPVHVQQAQEVLSGRVASADMIHDVETSHLS